MKTCILSKWYINIILGLLFGLIFFIYTSQNNDNLLVCSSDTKKVEICKSHLEKGFLDFIIPKNDIEKIDTDIVLNNGSKSYNFFEKYAKFIGFGIGLLAMLIIFVLNGLKFIIGLGKYKIINAYNLIIGYFLVFLLGLNFLYWEPRFTEIGVTSVQFFGHSLTLIGFYFILAFTIMLIVHTIVNLFSNKKENEKTN